MTITQTRPEASANPGSATVAAGRPRPAGITEWLTTIDHKKVGRLYVGFAVLFLLGDLVIGGLLACERIDATGLAILHRNAVAQLVSLYQFGLVFLVVVPLLLGLGIAVVPLQVGARSIAFPRAAALSLWGWLVGSGLVIGAYAANGGPGGGAAKAVNLYLAAMVLVVAALLVGCVCLATTIVSLRAADMDLREVPFFAWSWLVTASMLMLTLPILIGLLVFLYVDHRYGRLAFGGSAGINTYVAWAISQPQTFLYAVPVLGIVADIVPVFGRSRQKVGGIVMAAIAVAGISGFGNVEAAFYPNAIYKLLFVLMALAGAAAVLLVMATGATALLSGRPKFGAPLVFALLAGLVLFAGAAAGMFVPVKGLHLATFNDQPTVFLFAQFNLVLLAAVLGGVGAVVFWGPKLWGRRLGDGGSVALALLAGLGIALVAVPDVILGFAKQPFGAVTFDIGGPHDALNAISAIGYGVVLLGVLLVGAVAWRGFLVGAEAGDDPWAATTLEWTTSSPPPLGNFAVPVVWAAAPLELEAGEAR